MPVVGSAIICVEPQAARSATDNDCLTAESFIHQYSYVLINDFFRLLTLSPKDRRMILAHVLGLQWNLSRMSFFGARILSVLAVITANFANGQPTRFLLHHGWKIQSSCNAKGEGKEISTAGFSTTGWHRAEVPTTVVAALVADKTYADPDYGMNLKSLPGMNYPATEFFANQPMPEGSPFACSWWFRTEFTVPISAQGKSEWLHFDGLNYRANVWVNGDKVADAHAVAGTFRVFEFDVSNQLVA